MILRLKAFSVITTKKKEKFTEILVLTPRLLVASVNIKINMANGVNQRNFSIRKISAICMNNVDKVCITDVQSGVCFIQLKWTTSWIQAYK